MTVIPEFSGAAAPAEGDGDAQGHTLCVLTVPEMHCGACVARIEHDLNARSDIISARANLSRRQVRLLLPGENARPEPAIVALERLGFAAQPADLPEDETDETGRELLRATAVAGFGAMNVMLFSVGVWSGAEGGTRATFHLISALIAVPIVIYSGRPFFRSAFNALRFGRMNMDVPIALGVLLATGLSLFELVQHGRHVFFDAAVTLLFFLLAGRYLDHLMRQRAGSAVRSLARRSPREAVVAQPDGSWRSIPLAAVTPGDRIAIAPGDPVPVDVRILTGSTDLDRSLITGEALPVRAVPGDTLEAGTLNLTGRVEAEALRSAQDSFLEQMIRMQTEAEASRTTYVRVADRAARLYAPVVHITALATFLGWLAHTDGDWKRALFVAISVLIITCPCALGLAVPVAHVVAAGRLMRMGVLMKDGAALERLAEIDTAVFDKTGTLTTGRPRIARPSGAGADLAAATALAARSSHPAAQAIARELGAAAGGEVAELRELPGLGIEGTIAGRRARLGRSEWVGEIAQSTPLPGEPSFAFEGAQPISFPLTESLRPGAVEAVAEMIGQGVTVAMLSGDSEDRARRVAGRLGIADICFGADPADKIAYLAALQEDGRRTLMVGDGLNDAAALAAAHASMAPGSASDVGRVAAQFVFLRDSLEAVPQTLRLARRTAMIVRQNFTLAIVYNLIAIPLAVLGHVTPLIAALAMSISSIVVVANSLRLNLPGGLPAARAEPKAGVVHA